MANEGRVMLSRDMKTVRMERGSWSEVFPVEKIADRLAFYVWLTKRQGGRNAAVFAYAVDGLTRAADRVRAAAQ